MIFVNTCADRRRWDNLVNLETGTTLELGPMEEADVLVPPGFDDPWLRPMRVTPLQPRQPAVEARDIGVEEDQGTAVTTEEAAPAAEPETE